MNMKKKMILIFFLAITTFLYSGKYKQMKNVYYSQIDDIAVFKAPNASSEKLYILKKNDDEFIVLKNDEKNNFIKIKIAKTNVEGYIKKHYFDGNYVIHYSYNYMINDSKFSITGVWPAFYDFPNWVFQFYPNGIFFEFIGTSDEEAPVLKKIGKYEYNGFNKIVLNYKNGDVGYLDVIEIENGQKTIKMGKQIFNPDLFQELSQLQLNEVTGNEDSMLSDKFYLTSTIPNLRFRKTPKDGEFIRMLEKDEKIELLEKGETETIGGAKGTWVKVRTSKGEIGWCFDAYLKEIK